MTQTECNVPKEVDAGKKFQIIKLKEIAEKNGYDAAEIIKESLKKLGINTEEY